MEILQCTVALSFLVLSVCSKAGGLEHCSSSENPVCIVCLPTWLVNVLLPMGWAGIILYIMIVSRSVEYRGCTLLAGEKTAYAVFRTTGEKRVLWGDWRKGLLEEQIVNYYSYFQIFAVAFKKQEKPFRLGFSSLQSVIVLNSLHWREFFNRKP